MVKVMDYKRVLRLILDWIANIILTVFGLAALWFFAQLFIYASFTIPTNSMEPTIIPGDRIYVDKTYMGARLFDIFEALGGKSVEIYRSPGRTSLHNGDVVVFNFPYASRWDSIAMNVRLYYVKRCVAVPGDTLEIRNCDLFVNGSRRGGLSEYSANRLRTYFEDFESCPERYKTPLVVERAFPRDSIVPWTIREFGPLLIPGKGTRIKLDKQSGVVYRNYIEWETKGKIAIEEDTVYLNGVPIEEYEFQENYCFVVGDNAFNSQDSRYFGLLPEPFVVGKAIFIWKSVDRYTGKERKTRRFRRLNDQ
ncbi:MAG: signal peptidase I [Muribaculaceae bacterium]|nr:signal peptidase I [Muribaculaceae bacterium]